MKIQIKSISGVVLFETEAESSRDAVIAAVKAGVSLSHANLSYADLFYTNLSRVNLSHADLSRADLSRADLSHANLFRADLSRADLSRADLSRVNLTGANLTDANLTGANLTDANLRSAKNIPTIVDAQTSILPDGNIVGWKQCLDKVIVKLLIPQRAKRSNATGRKCRAEYVKVLRVYGAKRGISQYRDDTIYRVGKTVKCDTWNPDRWVECGGGIHFFLTRIEAENY